MTEKNAELLKVVDLVKTRNKLLLEENNSLLRRLNMEKKQSSSNAKKVDCLEKRVEFILETDINQSLNPSDKLR